MVDCRARAQERETRKRPYAHDDVYLFETVPRKWDRGEAGNEEHLGLVWIETLTLRAKVDDQPDAGDPVTLFTARWHPW